MQLILPQHYKITRLIFDHEGVIYGGYLRDVIAYGLNAKPNDIDFVVYRDRMVSLTAALEKLCYTSNEVELGLYDFTSTVGELIPLQMLVEERFPNTELGPSAEPDFNVNLLCFDGMSLGIWTEVYVSQQQLNDIFLDIQDKMAKFIGDRRTMADRLKKMYDRGWEVYFPQGSEVEGGGVEMDYNRRFSDESPPLLSQF
jgi:hypothetical protein